VIFADTGYFLALLNPRDQWHRAALSQSSRRGEIMVTTMWVLAEVGNSMRLGADRRRFTAFVQRLLDAPQMVAVPASDDWFQRGMALFEQRPDKEWSLTDCISFEVMRKRGITEALSADHHFEQAGFRILLKG
jgi:predicted nucleic acid-binding protein